LADRNPPKNFTVVITEIGESEPVSKGEQKPICQGPLPQLETAPRTSTFQKKSCPLGATNLLARVT